MTACLDGAHQLPAEVRNEIIRDNTVQLAKVAITESLRRMFQHIDVNNEGFITRAAFVSFLLELGLTVSKVYIQLY